MSDDFNRDVYCLAGLPFDAVDMPEAVSKLKYAASHKARCFFSTPNLNFLIASRSDAAFCDSVIQSDLVIADGMPLIWIAKLLQIPVSVRVAGSSLFESLRELDPAQPLRIYFFGGPDGVAEIAAQRINQTRGGLICVGYESPGFVSIEEMSETHLIDKINASRADFLVVSLGAKKGQAWITKNLSKLNVPVISHLGAVVNFEANKLKRAPQFMQNSGLEWLWRIKEEPALWRRYWHDGGGLLKLLITAVIPHACWLLIKQRRLHPTQHTNNVTLECAGATCRLIISGWILDPIVSETRSLMRQISLKNADIELDLTHAEYLSPGFLGLLLLLKKQLDKHGRKLVVVGIQQKTERLLKWNGLTYLLKVAAPN